MSNQPLQIVLHLNVNVPADDPILGTTSAVYIEDIVKKVTAAIINAGLIPDVIFQQPVAETPAADKPEPVKHEYLTAAEREAARVAAVKKLDDELKEALAKC